VAQQLAELHNHHTESTYVKFVVISHCYYQDSHTDAQQIADGQGKEIVENVHSPRVHGGLVGMDEALYTLDNATQDHLLV
jgi:hypothetical protein